MGAEGELIDLLRQAGIRVVAGSRERLDLALPDRGGVVTRVLRVVPGRLTPARIAEPDEDDPALYVAAAASSAVRSASRAGDFDLVTSDPPTVIVAGRAHLGERPPLPGAGKRGRVPWGRWAVARVLAARHDPLPQAVIAARTGRTQQAVSLALRQLPVRRAATGWIGGTALLDAFLAGYPGPGGMVQHWYGLDAPVTQARAVVDLAARRRVPALRSGDVAADEYAPWQQPATALVYLPEVLDLTPAGLTPADPADATLTTVLPADPTVLRTGAGSLADPVLTLWDLLNTSTGPAAADAAHALRTAITARGPDD